MAGEWLLLPQFAAAALMFGLAGWLIYLDWRSTVHRVFSAFLFLRGMVIIAGRVQDITTDPIIDDLWSRLSRYYLLALAPILIVFVLIYPRRRWLVDHLPGGAATLTLAMIVPLELAYLLDHCIVSCGGPAGLVPGPLLLLTLGFPLVSGLAAVALARELARTPPGHRRISLGLATIALTVNAAADGAFAAASSLAYPASWMSAYAPGAWTSTLGWAWPIAVVPVLWVAAILMRDLRVSETRGFAVRALVLISLAALTGIIAGLLPPSAHRGFTDPVSFVLGIWRLALPALIAYALVRHRLFDIDMTTRWAVSKGTFGAFFVAAFFVGAQTAQNYFGTRYDWLVGGVSAGLLLFAAQPLQRWAEKFAHRAIPSAMASGLDHDRRLAIYRSQAEAAWRNGVIERSERAMLDHLRENLDLALEETARLEAEVALHMGIKLTNGTEGTT